MILEQLGKKLLFLDGGMGTLLQAEGLLPGELPETWNAKRRETVINIHRQYFEAGSDIVLTNTFGANAIKFHDDFYSLENIIKQAVANVHEGAKKCNKSKEEYCVALDIGPTGKLMEPMGDLSFEEAYNTFAEVMQYGKEAGADLIHIETMSDTYELKAAVLAAKESTNLPVFATMIFNENGKLLTGGDVPSAVSMLEGLRVDAIGLNCGMGPKQMLPILKEMRKYTSLPIVVKANAGLPKQKNGETYYDVNPEEFANAMAEIVEEGGCVIGGCCGTTPEHISEMKKMCGNKQIKAPQKRSETIVSSYGKAVVFGEKPIIIGERINPTGKSKMKQALKENQLEYLLKEAITQQEKGADILDVNVGLPDINEPEMMKKVIPEIQSVTNLPLQIDTVNVAALEGAMRLYNGKPMVNSVTGKQESMDKVFPLIQKYGGVVVGLTLDEAGIPKTAEGRLGAYPRVEVQSQEALRKIIRMDRRSEFAFEGIRYRDLLRWRIAEKSHNKSMYYLNRAWSNSANWNGLTGSESNIELSQDFITLLKNWDEGNYPIGGIPTIDENGLPNLAPMETAGYITTFYKMSFDPKKNYLWPIPANDILVNGNLTQNDGY